jgi:hypothetical protein
LSIVSQLSAKTTAWHGKPAYRNPPFRRPAIGVFGFPTKFFRALAVGRNFPYRRAPPDTAAAVRWDSGQGTPDEGRFYCHCHSSQEHIGNLRHFFTETCANIPNVNRCLFV